MTTDGLWEHHSELASSELSQEIMSLKSSLAALYNVIVDISKCLDKLNNKFTSYSYN